jgi:BolA protein
LDRRARIESRLREELEAEHVTVVDESHLHAGHEGARDGGGHFRALVVSHRFEGQNPVARQRLVYAALAEEMGREIHALSMQTLTPAQWQDQRPSRA